MNKNFKEEYTEYTQQEIPDLWNRIEAKLPEKIVTSETDKKISIKRNRRLIHKSANYIGVLAACLCVAIIIPAILLQRKSLKQDDLVTAMSEETQVLDSTIETKSQPAKEDRMASSAKMAEETMATNDFAVGEEATTADTTASETNLYTLKIRVNSIGKNEENVYEMMVISPEESLFEANQIISVRQGSMVTTELTNGQEYEIVIRDNTALESSTVHDYVLEEIK